MHTFAEEENDVRRYISVLPHTARVLDYPQVVQLPVLVEVCQIEKLEEGRCLESTVSFHPVQCLQNGGRSHICVLCLSKERAGQHYTATATKNKKGTRGYPFDGRKPLLLLSFFPALKFRSLFKPLDELSGIGALSLEEGLHRFFIHGADRRVGSGGRV